MVEVLGETTEHCQLHARAHLHPATVGWHSAEDALGVRLLDAALARAGAEVLVSAALAEAARAVVEERQTLARARAAMEVGTALLRADAAVAAALARGGARAERGPVQRATELRREYAAAADVPLQRPAQARRVLVARAHMHLGTALATRTAVAVVHPGAAELRQRAEAHAEVLRVQTTLDRVVALQVATATMPRCPALLARRARADVLYRSARQ